MKKEDLFSDECLKQFKTGDELTSFMPISNKDALNLNLLSY